MTHAQWLEFLLDLADRADAIALSYFRSAALSPTQKADQTPVTAADLAIERMVREQAAQRHPGIGLYGEEFGRTNDAARTRLIVDPIDGTANFARGVPIFATLLALEHEGDVIAGVASAPALGTRWSAARGLGARRGAERITVSRIERLGEAQLFHAGLGGGERLGELPGLMELVRRTKRQRGFGDFYQDVLVAEGAGEIALDLGLAPWDVAALQVIIEEAGGRATSLDGRRDIYAGSLVSSNGVLHDEVLAILSARPTAG